MSDLSPLLGAERKSHLGGVRSVFDPTQTLQLQPRRPVHKTTIDAIDELAEKIWGSSKATS
jgi:hypothetical protein